MKYSAKSFSPNFVQSTSKAMDNLSRYFSGNWTLQYLVQKCLDHRKRQLSCSLCPLYLYKYRIHGRIGDINQICLKWKWRRCQRSLWWEMESEVKWWIHSHASEHAIQWMTFVEVFLIIWSYRSQLVNFFRLDSDRRAILKMFPNCFFISCMK